MAEVVEHERRQGAAARDAGEDVLRGPHGEGPAPGDLDLDLLDRLGRGGVRTGDQPAGQVGQLARPLAVGIAGRLEVARCVEQDRRMDVRGGVDKAPDEHRGQNSPVPLARISWIAAVAICVVAAVLLLVSGYSGYAGVLVAVGVAAAVNLL